MLLTRGTVERAHDRNKFQEEPGSLTPQISYTPIQILRRLLVVVADKSLYPKLKFLLLG
jgi:hypothetical protein